MATTTTDRLALKMQAHGDNAGSWEVDLNQGFLDADARFFLSGAGDPNTEEVESVYVGQRYYDTDTDLWWTAQDIGAPGTWVQPSLLMGAAGMCTGRLEWGSESTLVLTRAYGTVLYVEIDGIIVPLVGDLTFDMAADYFEGDETASEAVYLYVENDGGVLTPHIGDVPPHDLGDGKPGYNDTEATYRCIGSWWNGADGHLVKGQMDRDGWLRFSKTDLTDHVYDESSELTITNQSDYRSLTLKLPKTVSNVLLHVMGNPDGGATYMALARSDAAAATLPTSEPWLMSDSALIDAVAMIIAHSGTDLSVAANIVMPIADRTAPAMKYGHDNTRDWSNFEIVAKGYQDIWAPKGY